MGAMTLAMLVKNTPLACACRARLVLEGDMRVGSTPVGVALALAIVAASLAAGVLGYLVLRFAAPLPAPQAKET